jgi:hypothetical protein
MCVHLEHDFGETVPYFFIKNKIMPTVFPGWKNLPLDQGVDSRLQVAVEHLNLRKYTTVAHVTK